MIINVVYMCVKMDMHSGGICDDMTLGATICTPSGISLPLQGTLSTGVFYSCLDRSPPSGEPTIMVVA